MKVQVGGCTYRIGQGFEQYIYILKHRHTIDEYLEANNYLKMMDTFRALGEDAYREEVEAALDKALK